jgi:hypothetical protein
MYGIIEYCDAQKWKYIILRVDIETKATIIYILSKYYRIF